MKKWFIETVIKSWMPTVAGLVLAGGIAAAETCATGTISKEGMIAAALFAIAGAAKKSKVTKK